MRTSESSAVRDPVPPRHDSMPAADGYPTTQGFEVFELIPDAYPTKPNWPRIRGYEILSLIGSGGMGIVFKALHHDLQRTVALKMLRGAALDDLEFHVRFHAEAEAVARLQHPNIIQVFEVGTVLADSGNRHPNPFIALEYVDGGSLAMLTAKPQAPEYAARLVEKLARAAHFAHERGVVHRDLKPANVLLTRDGEPKIADFGLAKNFAAKRDDSGRFPTQPGTVMGTPEYMAPEQVAGETPTPAMDTYSLGVILYELLTTRVPFRAATPLETMSMAVRHDPMPPRRLQRRLPRDLETICLKCLAKEPGKRYASAQALADDLQRFLDGRPILARRMSTPEKMARWSRRNPLVAASLAGVAGIFLAAFVLVSRSYWRAEAALQEEAKQRQEAQRKEKAERWERYRANLVATAGAFQVNNVWGARRTLEAAPEEHRNWEWRHFHSRLDAAQHVLRGDMALAASGAITPDGKHAVLFGDGDLAQIWDTADPAKVRSCRGISGTWGVPLTPDGKAFALIGQDHRVTLREIEGDRIRATLLGHSQSIHFLQFTAAGSRVVTSSDDRTIRIWDAATGRQLQEISSTREAARVFDVSRDGGRLAMNSEDRLNASIRNAATGETIETCIPHELAILGGGFNPQGSRLLTVEFYPNNSLRLWDAATGRLLAKQCGHTNMVSKHCFSPDGARLATGSMDQTIGLWDGMTGEQIAILQGHNGWVTAVNFSPDGKRLVSGSQDHTVRLWDATTGKALAILHGHTAEVYAVAYTSDGRRIISASQDGTVRLWDAEMVESNGILRGHTSFVYGVAFHPDGERVASAGWDGTVRIWTATTGRQTALLKHGDTAIVSSIAFHPAGKHLASRSRNAVRLWDIESGREVHQWKNQSDGWRDTRLVFSPRGDLLATGSRNGAVCLFNVESQEELPMPPGRGDEVRDLAFSPDGQWLASGSNKSIRIWDVARRKVSLVLEGHDNTVYALAFNAAGKLLASGSTDGTVRLWDTSTWKEITVLKHGTNVYGVAFSQNGTRLACACADNSIRFWDVDSHQEIAELRGHTAYVHALAFSPDGTRLISASGDLTVRLWDTVRPQDRLRIQQ